MQSDKEQILNLKEGLNHLNEFAEKAIDSAFASFQDKLSAEGFKTWRGLTGKLAKALSENNVDAVESIKNDLEHLIEEEEKKEKENGSRV